MERQTYEDLVKLGIFIGGIFTALMVLVLMSQTSLMREDFDINNRPWIAGDQVRLFENAVVYDIQNFGNIPNHQGEVKFYLIKSDTATIPLNRNELPMERFKTQPLTVVMPTQKMSIFLTGDILKAINEVEDSGGFLQLVIILDYTYGKEKNGEYGYMGKYNPETNDFEIIETWAS